MKLLVDNQLPAALCDYLRPGDAGQLIWVRLGNCRNPALIASFDAAHDALFAALASGTRIVEVR